MTPPRSHGRLNGAHLFPYASLIGAMGMLSLGTSIAKSLFPLIGAEGTSAYRVGLSALLLLIVMRPWRTVFRRRDLLTIAPYGMALGFMNLSFYLALRTLPLGLAIAIEFFGPLTVSLLHSHRPIHFAMVGLALLGLLLLLPLRGAAQALDPVGCAFAMVAACCWALYIIYGKRTEHLPPGATVAWGMAVAAIVVVPAGVHDAGAALLKPEWLGMGLVVALVSSAVPCSLELIALRSLPAVSLGVLLSLEPAFGAVAGVVVLGEELAGVQWIAILVIVSTSIGMSLARPSSPRTRLVDP